MSAPAKVTMEIGREFAICEVQFQGGVVAKVVGIDSGDGYLWKSESIASEQHEDFALTFAKLTLDTVLNLSHPG